MSCDVTLTWPNTCRKKLGFDVESPHILGGINSTPCSLSGKNRYGPSTYSKCGHSTYTYTCICRERMRERGVHKGSSIYDIKFVCKHVYLYMCILRKYIIYMYTLTFRTSKNDGFAIKTSVYAHISPNLHTSR